MADGLSLGIDAARPLLELDAAAHDDAILAGAADEGVGRVVAT